VVPLYFQLCAALKDLLDTREWPPGARFATEREIEEQFDVSRAVVRPALELLVADGAIFRIRGSGSFVAPPRREVPVLGLVEALTHRPDNLTVKVLTAREETPDPPIARFLDMEQQPMPRIAHVTAVFHVDQRPACMVESYSSVQLAPWLLPIAQALKTGAPRRATRR
jgi:GntR family transcriptional regulator